MTKPMYCPMSFMRYATNTAFEKQYTPMECTPDCAWAFEWNGKYSCVIAVGNGGICNSINARPLKDDSE